MERKIRIRPAVILITVICLAFMTTGSFGAESDDHVQVPADIRLMLIQEEDSGEEAAQQDAKGTSARISVRNEFAGIACILLEIHEDGHEKNYRMILDETFVQDDLFHEFESFSDNWPQDTEEWEITKDENEQVISVSGSMDVDAENELNMVLDFIDTRGNYYSYQKEFDIRDEARETETMQPSESPEADGAYQEAESTEEKALETAVSEAEEVPQAQLKSQAEMEGIPETEPQPETQAEPLPDVQLKSQAETEEIPEVEPQPETQAESVLEEQPEESPEEEPVMEPEPQPELQPQSDPEMFPDSDLEFIPEPEPETAIDPEPEPEPALIQEFQPEPDPEPALIQEFQPEPEPEPALIQELQPEPDPESAMQPEPDPEPAYIPDPEPDPEPVPVPEFIPEPDLEPAMQPDQDPAPERVPQIQPVPEYEPEFPFEEIIWEDSPASAVQMEELPAGILEPVVEEPSEKPFFPEITQLPETKTANPQTGQKDTRKAEDSAGSVRNHQTVPDKKNDGSVYKLDEIESVNGKCVKELEDLVIYEYNQDKISKDTVNVIVTKDAEVIELDPEKDYSVKLVGDSEDRKIYRYVINKDVFNDSGQYGVFLQSEDESGNINQNEARDAEISFHVDHVAPLIISCEASWEQAQPDIREVRIKDNEAVENVEIYVADEKVSFDSEGDLYRFSIPENIQQADVRIIASDSAGNTYERILENYVYSEKAQLRNTGIVFPQFLVLAFALMMPLGIILGVCLVRSRIRKGRMNDSRHLQ